MPDKLNPTLRDRAIHTDCKPDAPTVYVVLNGGLVESVYCESPINVVVLDVDDEYDDEDAEADRATLAEIEAAACLGLIRERRFGD